MTNKLGAWMVVKKLGFNVGSNCSLEPCGTILNQGNLVMEKCTSLKYGQIKIVNEGNWSFSGLGAALGLSQWPAECSGGKEYNGYITPGPHVELKSTSTYTVRAYSPVVAGKENMDIMVSGGGTCLIDGTLHVQLMFPDTSQTAWTIAAGDEWLVWNAYDQCSGGFNKVTWSGVGGQLPASLSLSLKKVDVHLYVVVCSLTDAGCNTLPAKQTSTYPTFNTGGTGGTGTNTDNSALSFILSSYLIICIFF